MNPYKNHTDELTQSDAFVVEELTCIVCPKSCSIRVERDKETGEILSIEHAACKRGRAWVTQEITDPRRIICSSIRVIGGDEPLAGVKIDRAVSRDDVMRIMTVIRECSVPAPVEIGDIVLRNPAGTDCSVVVTRGVSRKSR